MTTEEEPEVGVGAVVAADGEARGRGGAPGVGGNELLPAGPAPTGPAAGDPVARAAGG